MQDKCEFLAVERGGIALYSAALQLIFDREVSRRFKQFSEQTRRHERILLAVIEAVGMDRTYVSAEAATAQQKADALLKTMRAARAITARTAELNAIENIVLAEIKDHTDWEFLGKIARQCEDPKLREVLQPAVSEVEPQESEHLNWTKKQLARLAFTDVCEKDSSAWRFKAQSSMQSGSAAHQTGCERQTTKESRSRPDEHCEIGEGARAEAKEGRAEENLAPIASRSPNFGRA